jgi:pSer/pThr/pTyr-binding forkhead associated (FHA) protein
MAAFNLIIEDDAGKQIVVPFAKDVITIGRKEGNTIRLTERNVSRFHAKLSKQDGHVVVEDLKSFNGVKLNGDRIAGRVQVAAGDVIEIGDYHLELRTAQPQALGPTGARSAAVADAVGAGADDEFEGDTQRWEPPTGGSLPVGRPPRSAPAGAAPLVDAAGDTERVDVAKLHGLSAQAWPPPQSQPHLTLGNPDLEATARQPVSRVPLGGQIAPPTIPNLTPVHFQATQSMMAPPVVSPSPSSPSASATNRVADALSDATIDMPMPVRAPPVAPRVVEQTEQIRIATPPHPGDDLTVPRLVVLSTVFAGTAYPLRAAEAVLGRTDDNDIVVEHRSISRNHCKLVREGDRVRILDLKSANGILVNGEEVEQAVLRSGDIVELGKVRVRFVPIGERFAVSPEDIQRARLSDAGLDGETEMNATLPTAGFRINAAPPAQRPVVLYAVVAVLVVVVLILAVLVLRSGAAAPAAPTATTSTSASTPTLTAAVSEPASSVHASSPPASSPPASSATNDPAPATATAPTETTTTTTTTTTTLTQADERAVRAIERKKPFDPATASKQAAGHILRGDYGQAVVVLNQLIERNPNDARAHFQLGLSYDKLRNAPAAKTHFQRYVTLEPTGKDAELARKRLREL